MNRDIRMALRKSCDVVRGAVCCDDDQSGVAICTSASSLALPEDNPTCTHSLLLMSCNFHRNTSHILWNVEQINAASTERYRLSYYDILSNSTQLVTLADYAGLQ